jgi:pimeloyl-ACP methyl ester carboxylesterase
MGSIDQHTSMLEISGQKVRVYEAGTGPEVVVLHGWRGRIESMAPVLSCLVRNHRVVSIDLPGFGESPAPSEVWGTPHYAGLVKGVLERLGIAKADFVGHSYGGKTALYLAATTQVVDRLVLQGSSGLRTAPSASARFKRMLSKTAKAAGRLGPLGRSFRQAVYDRIASQDYKDAGPMRPILVKVVNEDLSDICGQVKSSTLLVWGSEDTASPLNHAKRFEKLIPDAGLVVFEGAGHFAYLDEQQRFCTIVSHFLKRDSA